MAIDRDLRIVGLKVENFKRIKAVDLAIDPNFQVITGRNAQGKTSVMDAIWAALAGGKAAPERPIRDGEAEAFATVDLGDIIVSRKWKDDKSTITVETEAGAKFSRPQTELDSILGKLSFDPVAFMALTPAKQREELLALVPGLDDELAKLDQKHAALYEERTEVGRQEKAIGDVQVDDTLPTEEKSAAALIGEIQAGKDTNRERENLQDQRRRADDAVALAEENVRRAEEALKAAKEQHKEVHNTPLPPEVDTSELETSLASVEETNAAIRANNTARAQAEIKGALSEKYSSLSDQIKAIDQQKKDALARAKFPVDGLGFDETGVTYKGVPISQASAAEQRKVSTAIARAFNPKLRTAFIRDGSLLDSEAMAWFREDAIKHDYQLLVERVDDDDPNAIVIEDGEALEW